MTLLRCSDALFFCCAHQIIYISFIEMFAIALIHRAMEMKWRKILIRTFPARWRFQLAIQSQTVCIYVVWKLLNRNSAMKFIKCKNTRFSSPNCFTLWIFYSPNEKNSNGFRAFYMTLSHRLHWCECDCKCECECECLRFTPSLGSCARL